MGTSKKDIGSMPGFQVAILLKVIGTNKLVVEIGSYRGVTARRIARAGNKVICIEPFMGEYDKSKVSKELAVTNTVKRDFIKNTKDLPITLIEDYSYNAIKNFDKEIDVLIIDGEHSYNGIKRDIEWIKFVKPCGIIAFHDYGLKQFPGIKDAVDEFITGKYVFIKNICTLKVFRNEVIDNE